MAFGVDEETILGISHTSCCGRRVKKKSLLVVLFTFASVCGALGQTAGLPLFIASFASPKGLSTGVYFVVFFASCLFNVVFWPVVLFQSFQGKINKETKDYTFSRKHYKLVLIGACDALNGILTVFSSSNARVPGALQPILLQAIIPLTLIFSKIILKKKYVFKQLCGGGLVIMGILVSLIPIIQSIATGNSKTQLQSGFYWPIILLVATVPGVLMNILEEDVFEDVPKFNIIYLLAWESLYQLLTVAFFFWADLIPGFGTSKDIAAFGETLKGGFSCFFAPDSTGISHCKYSALLGLGFAGAYCVTYVFGSALMKLASANYQGLVSAITNPLSVLFWISLPAVNKWAGGKHYGSEDIIFDCLSLPFMALGIYMFRRFEMDNLTRRAKTVSRSYSRNHSHVGGIKDALLPFAASDYATAGKQPGDSGHLMMAPSTDDGTGDDVLVTA